MIRSYLKIHVNFRLNSVPIILGIEAVWKKFISYPYHPSASLGVTIQFHICINITHGAYIFSFD